MDTLTKALKIITNSFEILGKKVDVLASEVKKQKAPIVNVAAPEVNVNVPDVVVPEINIPEFPAFPPYPAFPEIKLPEINVTVPEIKLPTIVVPKQEAPIVNVPPANITVTPTPVEFPSEMKIAGMDKLIAEVSRETEEKSIFEEVSSKRPLSVQIMDNKGKPIVDFGGDMTAPSIVGLKNISNQAINPATESTLQSIAGLNIPEHDEIVLSYTVDNLTGVVYKNSSVTVATLTLAYDGSKLTSVIKT